MIKFGSPEEKLRAAGAIVEAFAPRVIGGGLMDDPAGGKPWPKPTPIASTLPPVQRLKAEMLPRSIGGYIIDIAERQQSPIDFSAVATLCGLSAVIGNRVRIAPKLNDDWTVVPNLWGGIIGRPSAMKSPAMNSALAALYGLQDTMRTAWEGEVKALRVDETLATLDAKDTKKRAEKALKNGDREAARSIISDMDAQTGDGPPCPRLVVNDASVEKLGELLNENPRGLLLVRDELPGFLAKMEREEFQSERAFYLEAFNGDGRFTYDRIGRGTVHIENCTLSIIGGIQPSRIAPIVRGAMTGASNDGLIQRLQLTVWPDDNPNWKWVDRHPQLSDRLAFEKVFSDLHDSLPGSPDEPTVLRFSAVAQDMFRAWMIGLQKEARAGGLSSVLESHLLKFPKTISSLALIFELVDGGRFEVGADALSLALLWADYLRTHANRLYASGESLAEDGARLIVSRRQQLPEVFTARAVHKKSWAGLADHEAVTSAIEVLVDTNHCREVEQLSGPAGGRPTTAYAWNPQVQDEK